METAFTSSFFTGSISGSQYSGPIHGTFTSCISGSLYGQLTGSVGNFNGYVSNFTGLINGTISGSYVGNQSVNITTQQQLLKRSLIQFDFTAVSNSLINSTISDPTFTLKLKITNTKNVSLDYYIYAFPLSQSWAMGTGFLAYGGGDDGCNWVFSDNTDQTSYWYYPYNAVSPNPSVNYITSDSASYLNFERGGGTWYYRVPNDFNQPTSLTSSQFYDTLSGSVYIASYFSDIIPGNYLFCSQSYSYQTSDVNMDITPIVKTWIAGGIPNNGLILLTSDEVSGNADGNTFNFFSKETNTIYTPYVDVSWDDSSYNTGSLLPLNTENGVSVAIKNLKKQYQAGSKPRINVFTRELYPQMTFSQLQPQYLTPQYLLPTTYYRIQDNESEEIFVDFGESSKLSLDGTYGHYFVMDTDGMAEERFYRILIKTIYTDGSVEVFDTNAVFKISR